MGRPAVAYTWFEVMSLLRQSPNAASYVPDVEQFVGTNPNTRTSTTTTIMPALAWLSNEAARGAASDSADRGRAHAALSVSPTRAAMAEALRSWQPDHARTPRRRATIGRQGE